MDSDDNFLRNHILELEDIIVCFISSAPNSTLYAYSRDLQRLSRHSNKPKFKSFYDQENRRYVFFRDGECQ